MMTCACSISNPASIISACGGPSGGWNRTRLIPSKHGKRPAHGRSIGGLLDLVGHDLAGGCQPLAQAVLGQPIDQEAGHHDKRESHDALGLLDEDRRGKKQRIFENREAALDAALVLVRLDELQVAELLWSEDLGRDKEGRLASRFAGHRLVVERDRGSDLPLLAVGDGIAVRSFVAAVLGMRDDTAVHIEPVGTHREVLGEGGVCICLTDKAAVT